MNDRPQNRKRYWGMTMNQVVMLGAFGVLTFGLLAGMGWMIWNASQSGPAALSPVSVVPPTTDLLPQPSMTEAFIPQIPSPTATSPSYESLIPEGWIQITSGKAEFWVPASFMKQDPGEDLLSLVEKSTVNQDVKTEISLSKESVPGMDLDTYVDENLDNFPDFSLYMNTTILEKKDFKDEAYEIKRIRVEYILLNVPVEHAYYIVKDGDTFWAITCATYLKDFMTWLSDFDKVARTFRVNP